MTTTPNVAFLLHRNSITLCGCPTCGVSRDIRAIKSVVALSDRLAKEEILAVVVQSVEDLEHATDAWMDDDCERDMSYAWLSDEVEAILKSPWWKPSRKRLRRALDIAKN